MISFLKLVNFGERRQLEKLSEPEKLSRAKREQKNSENGSMMKRFLIVLALCTTLHGKEWQFASPITQYKLEQVGFKYSVEDRLKKDIRFIISALGNDNALKLGKKQSELEKRGKTIEVVPTLQFLAVIFSEKELKKSMTKIKARGRVLFIAHPWKKLMSGISGGLKKQLDRGELMDQLPQFAELVGADYNALKRKAIKQNWEGFVSVLMQ